MRLPSCSCLRILILGMDIFCTHSNVMVDRRMGVWALVAFAFNRVSMALSSRWEFKERSRAQGAVDARVRF